MYEHVLFTDFVSQWLREVAPLRYKPTAVTEYASLLRRHLVPAFGLCALSDITPAVVQRYLVDKAASGLSPRSLRNHLTVLRAVLRATESFGLVGSNAAQKVHPPRQVRREQRFLSPAELKAVLSATKPAWRCLIGLPIYAGARRGEALALRWPEVSFERRQIAFVRSIRAGTEYTVKTSASRASVALGDELATLLSARRDSSPDPVGGYVFSYADGRPLNDSVPGRVLRTACLTAGIEPCGYHALRHSAIAALIQSGAHPLVVSRFARHASIETTLDVYGHILAPLGGDAVADIGRLIEGSQDASDSGRR